MNFLVKVCDYERMNMERLSARLFVGFGAGLWLLAAGSAYTGYWGPTLQHGVGEALVLGITALAVLGVGWMFERVGALLVFASALATVVYGIVMGWEAGVFVTVGLMIVVPMIMAGLMFLTAAETQSVCQLEESRKA
jgi:hypothetical protein